jgi:hypothetical protein
MGVCCETDELALRDSGQLSRRKSMPGEHFRNVVGAIGRIDGVAVFVWGGLMLMSCLFGSFDSSCMVFDFPPSRTM